MKRFPILSALLALCLLCACAAPAADDSCPICTAPTPEDQITAVENCTACLSMSAGDAQLTLFLDARHNVLTVHGDNDAGAQLADAAEQGPLFQVLLPLLTATRDAGYLSDGSKITMLACTSPDAERELLLAYHETVDGWLSHELPAAVSEVLPSYLLGSK